MSTGWRPWLRNLSPLPGLSGRFGKDAHERWIGAAQTQHSAWADASLSSSSWECSLHGSSSDAALRDGSGARSVPGAPDGPSRHVRAGTGEPREEKRRGRKDKQDIVDPDYEVVDEDKDK